MTMVNIKNNIEVLLIRHGETDYNRDGRFAGVTDVPLNNTGIKQSKTLGKRLKGEKIDAVFASRLRRCRHTVDLINFKADIEFRSN